MAVRHHIRVIVVESDPNLCRAMEQLLEERGYRPFAFTQAEEALKIARDQSFQIGIVDLGSPHEGGLDTIARLKDLNGRMGCIVLSAHPTLESAVQAMRAGACDFLGKPASSEVLLQAVDLACKAQGLVYTNEPELNRFIGQRIRAERLRQNLTLRQLSDRTDLTTSQLSQVELGKNAASIWALARIANSLGMQMHTLLQGL